MTATIFYAPVHQIPGKPASGNYSNNPDMAPGMTYGGGALYDPRYPYLTGNRKDGQGGVLAPQILGWLGAGCIKTVAQIPSAISVSNIAAAQAPTNGTPMTLVGATGAGITYMAAATLLLPSLVIAPIGTLAIDGPVGFKKFGLGFQTWFYDPATMCARSVSITGVASSPGGNFLISGADLYGYAQTQLLAVGAGAVTATTLKPFKYVYSITPQFTSTYNYSAGTSDVYDLGIAADFFADTDVYWANVIQLVAQFGAAVTTTPATDLTGSTRGTFSPATASNGTNRLDIFVEPSAARVAQVPMATGLTGVTPA